MFHKRCPRGGSCRYNQGVLYISVLNSLKRKAFRKERGRAFVHPDRAASSSSFMGLSESEGGKRKELE